MRRFILALAAIAACTLLLTAAPARATFRGRKGRITFYANRDDRPSIDIYAIGRTGAGRERLTALRAALHEDWSPDGTRIVFELDDPNGPTGCNTIEIMNADGSGVVDITGQRHDCEREPSFTPDGRRIVFSRQRCDHGCTTSIWSMDLKGRDRQRITRTFSSNASEPNVSPDGSRMIFQLTRGGNLGGALYIVDMNGKHLQQIVPFSLEVGIKSNWSPDGSRILFTEYLDEEANLPSPNVATVRPDGSDLVQLTHQDRPEVAAIAGSYSPDGRWIVFRFDNLDTGKYTLTKMRPNGGNKTRIARLRLKERGMDWGSRPR